MGIRLAGAGASRRDWGSVSSHERLPKKTQKLGNFNHNQTIYIFYTLVADIALAGSINSKKTNDILTKSSESVDNEESFRKVSRPIDVLSEYSLQECINVTTTKKQRHFLLHY